MKIFARIIVCVAALLLISACAALALPARSFERAEVFATCSGRLEALAVHDRAYREDNSPEIGVLSSTFTDLLHAVLPDAHEEGVPANQHTLWRVAGWSEVAALLNEVYFTFDAARSMRAANALRERIMQCTELILPKEEPDWVNRVSGLTH
ncbi:MAG: hypothetical protein AAGA05_11935 [Pseudomonadota bacterium]